MSEPAEHQHHGGHKHTHDDIDWAAMADELKAWDELEAGLYRDVVEWLGVTPGQTAVDVGSGAGGMASALLDAVGHAGTVIVVDGARELLALARQRAWRPGHHVVAVHADLEQRRLGDVLAHRPVDLVHASAVVHHLDDEVAAIADLASVVRPGGRVAVAEGGLVNRFLPDDCGIGEPGLEHRLMVARDRFFWSEVRPADATVRTGRGWNVLLSEAGLVAVTTRSFLLDLPPPLGEHARQVVRGHFERELERSADVLSAEDQATLRRLTDPDDPLGVMQRPDVYVLGVRTVHTGVVPG